MLDFVVPPRYTLENLLVHEGIRAAINTLCSAYRQSSDTLLPALIWGPSGTGKTHILHAILEFIDKHEKADHPPGVFLGAHGKPPRFPELAHFVSNSGVHPLPRVVAVDDVHLMEPGDAAHLWTLYNVMDRKGRALLLGSRISPEELFQENPHMRSRLLSGLVVWLDHPSDHTKLLIMEKLALDRQVAIPPAVLRYLVVRRCRSIGNLEQILNILDRESLRQKRKITIPFLKELEREGIL